MRARTVVAIAVGLVVAAGSVTLAASGTAGDAGPDPANVREGRPPVAAVPPDQAAAFGVLRRPAGARDQLPPSALRAVAFGPQPQFGANPALARRAADNAGDDVFLVPAEGRVCLVTEGGGATCNHLDQAVEGYFVLVQGRGAGGARVYAGLPDGVRRVEVVTAGGGRTGADVEANVAIVDAEGQLEALTFADAGGEAHRVPIFSPPE